MSDYSPEDIVKYSTTKDGARVKEAIHGVIANKVMKALEAKKAEVAQSMFNSAVGSEKPEVAVSSTEVPVVEPNVEIPKADAVEA